MLACSWSRFLHVPFLLSSGSIRINQKLSVSKCGRCNRRPGMISSLLHRGKLYLAITAARIFQPTTSPIQTYYFPLLLQFASFLAHCSLVWKYGELAYWLSGRIFLCSLVSDLDDNFRGSVHLILTSARRTPDLDRRHFDALQL